MSNLSGSVEFREEVRDHLTWNYFLTHVVATGDYIFAI